jgi:hypothetical protein
MVTSPPAKKIQVGYNASIENLLRLLTSEVDPPLSIRDVRHHGEYRGTPRGTCLPFSNARDLKQGELREATITSCTRAIRPDGQRLRCIQAICRRAMCGTFSNKRRFLEKNFWNCSDYSITSSARRRKASGIVRPGGELHRQIAHLGAAQDAVNIGGGTAVLIGGN